MAPLSLFFGFSQSIFVTSLNEVYFGDDFSIQIRFICYKSEIRSVVRVEEADRKLRAYFKINTLFSGAKQFRASINTLVALVFSLITKH